MTHPPEDLQVSALSPPLGHPLETLRAAHHRKTALCDLLESIADDLPHPDPDRCRRAAAHLSIELPVHHADEDLGLFPLLRQRCEPEDRIEPVLDRLCADHVDDEANMLEIIALLRSFASGRPFRDQAASAGYALRGFFEGQRRHIAWEDAVVMPMAEARLSLFDLEVLRLRMTKNRLGPRPSALLRGRDSATAEAEAEAEAESVSP